MQNAECFPNMPSGSVCTVTVTVKHTHTHTHTVIVCVCVCVCVEGRRLSPVKLCVGKCVNRQRPGEVRCQGAAAVGE